MVTRHGCTVLALALLSLLAPGPLAGPAGATSPPVDADQSANGCVPRVPNDHGLVLMGRTDPVPRWGASAHLVAVSMRASGMIETPGRPAMPGRIPYPGPYFLYVQQPDSTFLAQVRDELECELLWSGAAVVRSPVGATVINLDVDVVSRTAIWHVMIVSNSRVLMKLSHQFSISADDSGLYRGTAAFVPLASPGVALLGAAVPLHYAR
jgi:hypothetical protein